MLALKQGSLRFCEAIGYMLACSEAARQSVVMIVQKPLYPKQATMTVMIYLHVQKGNTKSERVHVLCFTMTGGLGTLFAGLKLSMTSTLPCSL